LATDQRPRLGAAEKGFVGHYVARIFRPIVARLDVLRLRFRIAPRAA
jgi:hypothetical protein